MKVKILLCNCKGLCNSFKDADMNTLPFQVESELEVQYAVLHPQFCGQGGNAVLARSSGNLPVIRRRTSSRAPVPGSRTEALQESAAQHRFR